MIVTYQQKKDQQHQRLALKTAEAAFCHEIVGGTNCTAFEAQIIVEKAKQHFGLGEYAEERFLREGQMIYVAVSAAAPAGLPIGEAQKLRVVLTHLSKAEDLEVLAAHGASAKRRQQMLRMAGEAQEQGALLTQEDLAWILDCHVRTVRADLQALRAEGLSVPTRGAVRDIGPGVSHKRRAVELWLSGKEALEVARAMHHSLHAVERYIQTFCRVVYAQRTLGHTLKTALVVGISVAGVNTYWGLHRELIKEDAYRRSRLEEVLQIGQAHWEACDGGKNPSPRPKLPAGGGQP